MSRLKIVYFMTGHILGTRQSLGTHWMFDQFSFLFDYVFSEIVDYVFSEIVDSELREYDFVNLTREIKDTYHS